MRPVEDAPELVPIRDAFELEKFHGSAGDDEAVELLMPDAFPIAIEVEHMFGRRILGRVRGDLYQRHLHLQRSGADQPRELRLGLDLIGHEIEEADAQGPDILPDRSILGHHHDPLLLEGRTGRKVVGNFDRHWKSVRLRDDR